MCSVIFLISIRISGDDFNLLFLYEDASNCLLAERLCKFGIASFLAMTRRFSLQLYIKLCHFERGTREKSSASFFLRIVCEAELLCAKDFSYRRNDMVFNS